MANQSTLSEQLSGLRNNIKGEFPMDGATQQEQQTATGPDTDTALVQDVAFQELNTSAALVASDDEEEGNADFDEVEVEEVEEGAVLEFFPFAGLVSQSITLVATSGKAYSAPVDTPLNFSNPFSKKGGALRTTLESVMEPLVAISNRDVLLIADNIQNAGGELQNMFQGMLAKVIGELRQDDFETDMPLTGQVSAEPTFSEDGRATLHLDTQVQSLYSDLNSRAAVKQFENLNVFARNIQKSLGSLALNLVFKFSVDDMLNPDTYNAVSELRNMKSTLEFLTYTRATANEMVENGFNRDLVAQLFMDTHDCIVVACTIRGQTVESNDD